MFTLHKNKDDLFSGRVYCIYDNHFLPYMYIGIAFNLRVGFSLSVSIFTRRFKLFNFFCIFSPFFLVGSMGQFTPSSPVPAKHLPPKSPKLLRIFHRRWQSSSAIKVCFEEEKEGRRWRREGERARERGGR